MEYSRLGQFRLERRQVHGRSTYGWLVQIEGSTVSWRAKRHETVALSTTGAEYTALSQCEEVEAGHIDVQYVSTHEQVGNGLTKP